MHCCKTINKVHLKSFAATELNVYIKCPKFPDLIIQLSSFVWTPFHTYLQWELIERVNLLQVIQDKVQQRRSGCSRSIVLSGDVNILLCSFSFFHLLFNLCGRSFGSLEVFYESCVSEEVPSSGGETREERIFKLFEFDLELILLSSQLSLHQRIHVHARSCTIIHKRFVH